MIAAICESSAFVPDPPHRAVPVLADQERAVSGHGNAHRSCPDASLVENEAGHEVHVFSGRNAILQHDLDDLVSRAPAAVPGAMLGSKDGAAILGGELRSIVEGQL